MRSTAEAYSNWMRRHVLLKARYGEEFKYKPSMDWEMREMPPGFGSNASEPDPNQPDPAPSGGGSGRRRLRREEPGAGAGDEAGAGKGGGTGTGGGGGVGTSPLPSLASPAPAPPPPRPRQQRKRRRIGDQPYVDGREWLEAALGEEEAQDPAAWEALKLPFPFCARHDERCGCSGGPEPPRERWALGGTMAGTSHAAAASCVASVSRSSCGHACCHVVWPAHVM